jgi:hypothetical protein
MECGHEAATSHLLFCGSAVWDRWQAGESMISPTGVIRPPDRHPCQAGAQKFAECVAGDQLNPLQKPADRQTCPQPNATRGIAPIATKSSQIAA